MESEATLVHTEFCTGLTTVTTLSKFRKVRQFTGEHRSRRNRMQVKDPGIPALARFSVYCCDKHDDKHGEDMVSALPQLTGHTPQGSRGRNSRQEPGGRSGLA